MPSAIILLNATQGTENKVLKQLRSNGDVQEAHIVVQSVFDVVAKVKAETFDKLKETIVEIKRSLSTHDNIVTVLLVEEAPKAAT